jgi:hypothetical protein
LVLLALALLRVAALLQVGQGFACYWRLGLLRLGFAVLRLPLRVWALTPHQS